MQSYAYRRNPSGSEQATIQNMSSTTLADLARACKPGFIPSKCAGGLDQNVRCHKQPTGTIVTIPSSHSSQPSRFRLVAAVTSPRPDRCDMQGQYVNLHCLQDHDPSTRPLTPLDHLPTFPPTQRVPLFFTLCLPDARAALLPGGTAWPMQSVVPRRRSSVSFCCAYDYIRVCMPYTDGMQQQPGTKWYRRRARCSGLHHILTASTEKGNMQTGLLDART